MSVCVSVLCVFVCTQGERRGRRGAKKRLFEPFLSGSKKTPSIYQDRLGTDTSYLRKCWRRDFLVRRRCCPRSCCCAPSTTRTTLRAVPQQQQQQRKLSARGPHRARLRRRRRRQRKLSGRVAAALLASPAGVTTAALGAISGEKQTPLFASSLLYSKNAIILPRQARDKHCKSPKNKRGGVGCGVAVYYHYSIIKSSNH
jgi:hypothetical protein